MEFSQNRKNISTSNLIFSSNYNGEDENQINQGIGKNMSRNLFKNYEYEKVIKNAPQKPLILSFDEMRRLHPEIDFLRDKVDFSSLIRESKFFL